MKNTTKTTITVHIFLNGEEIPASSLNKLIISNKTIDRIINNVVDQMNLGKEDILDKP